jgi:hypothetical protein
VNGYANLIAARLRKLADERSTGMLPVSGRGDGAIFFRDGQIVYAKSARTSLPGPPATDPEAPGLMPGEEPGPGGERTPGEAGVAAPRPASLGGALKFTELVIDAITELLSSESRYAKFRPGDALPDGHGRPIAVETLLAEVQRRHEMLRQLAPAVSPDTPVACEASLGPPSAQVSPVQWALLRRAGDETTPRALAVHLSRSVFGTTLEVYQLVELGLLVVRGGPPPPHHEQPATISFIRAVGGGKGTDG